MGKKAHLAKAYLLLGTALVSGASFVSAAQAQAVGAEADSAKLEEIIVTAQKREQSVQDVPIAVTAISEQTIQANRITNVQDLSGLAPNVIVRPAAGGSAIPSFSMRGLTSYGVVPGSDKQVSINLDGVYISATRGALFELPDIARIEVLRGPQGTLFGRNATAGAVSIVTKDPDGEFGGRLEAGIGNFDQRRVRLSLDLPKVGPFSAFVSFVHNERRGDIRNLGAGTRWDRSGSGTFNGKTYNTGQGVSYSPEWLGSKNVETYFAAVKFEPSDSFRLVYKFDLSADASTPEGVAVTALNTAQPSSGAGGVIIGLLAANQPVGGGPFGPIVLNPSSQRPHTVNNFYTVPSYLRNEGHSLTANAILTDNISVKNIASYRKSNLREATSQIGGVGGLVVTQEGLNALGAALIPNFAFIPTAYKPAALAALGASLGGVNPAVVGSRMVDVGTNIQNVSQQWSNELQFNITTDPVTLTLGGIYFHSKDTSGSPQFSRGTAQLSFFPATGENPLGGASAPTAVSYNKATSYAAYAQAEVHVTPALDLVLGGRITHDKKSGNFLSGINRLNGATTGTFTSSVAGCPTNTSNPVGDCRMAGTYAGLVSNPFTYSDTRPIYSVGINYKPSDDLLAYAKFSTGYVSGGAIGGITFKPETVRALEAGIKADLLDRRLRTNLAVFLAKYKNVQTAASGRNIFDSTLNRFRTDLGTAIITGYNEKAYGFEFEATAVPVDRLTLRASLGYTHIDQSNYNPLYVSSFVVPGQPLPAHLRPTGTPKWTSNLSAQYETEPLFSEATLLFRMDANWRARLYHDSNRDRSKLIPAFASVESSPAQWILNGRVALRDVPVGAVKAELGLWARNLTDNKDAQFVLVVPFQASASYQQARTFGADLILKF